MLGRRVGVLITEQAEKRAADAFCKIDRRRWLRARQLRGIVDDHVAAPAIHGGIDIGHAACCKIGLSSAGAEANHADLTVAIALRAQKLGCPRKVAYYLVIGHT